MIKPMSRKLLIKSAIGIFSVALFLCIFAYGVHRSAERSFYRAVRRAGLSGISIAASGIDAAGVEYRVVTANTSEAFEQATSPLLVLHRGFMGFWSVAHEVKPNTGPAMWYWSVPRGGRAYGFSIFDFPHHLQWEHHTLIHGNNADRLIELPLHEMPQGVSVNISQYSSLYTIHIVASGRQGDNVRQAKNRVFEHEHIYALLQ